LSFRNLCKVAEPLGTTLAQCEMLPSESVC